MEEDGQDTHIKQRKTWGGEGEETNTRPPQRWHTHRLTGALSLREPHRMYATTLNRQHKHTEPRRGRANGTRSHSTCPIEVFHTPCWLIKCNSVFFMWQKAVSLISRTPVVCLLLHIFYFDFANANAGRSYLYFCNI